MLDPNPKIREVPLGISGRTVNPLIAVNRSLIGEIPASVPTNYWWDSHGVSGGLIG